MDQVLKDKGKNQGTFLSDEISNTFWSDHLILTMVTDGKQCLLCNLTVGLQKRGFSMSVKRSKTFFRSLLFCLTGEVSWLAVEVLSPCKNKSQDF